MKHKLCHINEIPELYTKQFSLQANRQNLEFFVTRLHGEFFAYKNSCPHTGATLNWQADDFLDNNKHYIQCSMHNALFEIDSGYCIAGPCKGASLAELELVISNEIISLMI